MNTPRPANLARRLFGNARREQPSPALRARILAAGRAELERSRAERKPATAPTAQLTPTRSHRAPARTHRWAATAAFAAAAAGLLYLKAAPSRDQTVLISAEQKPTPPSPPSTQSPNPNPIPIPIPIPNLTPTPIPNPNLTPIPNPTPNLTPTPNPNPIPNPIPTPPPPPSLADQLTQIKTIRSALRSGDPQRALALIDAYRSLPKGDLAAEASLLRIEALALSGQRDTAAREARQFAIDYPNSPLIDRALSFAGDAQH